METAVGIMNPSKCNTILIQYIYSWRVAEISQILLVLLDSRCALLHYPPSLHTYLTNLRPPRKLIFVLTKVDISGSVRSSLWMNWLSGRFPGAQIVPAESYSHGISGASRDKQRLEPYFPVELKTRLIEALQKAYTELCTPPLDMRTGLPRKDWKPTVPQNIDWSKFFGTSGYGDHDEIRSALSNQRRSNTENSECEYLTVGLIGALLVHISSL